MSRPRLLDLFCGAGGAAKGYQRAGFYVVGVDIKPQPHYCGDEFVQADVMTVPWKALGRRFDAVHASPPCQAYSTATRKANRKNHPDLIAPVRQGLVASCLPWIIENVPGAPLRSDFNLCGCMWQLNVERERLFETSWYRGFELRPPCYHADPVINTQRTAHGPFFRKHGRVPTRIEIGRAMGVDWMRGDEVKQAIPPAYTEFIGKQLMEYLK